MTSLKLVACMALATLVTGDVIRDRREPVDGFRMMEAFPRIVSIYASTNDTDLLCATGNRTYLDLGLKKATYVWDLKGHRGSVKRNVTFDVEEGEAPDLVTYYVYNECATHSSQMVAHLPSKKKKALTDRTQPHTARCVYIDYDACMIFEMRFLGHDQCMLWVKPAIVDHVPRHCRSTYKRKCHVKGSYTTYDRDLCKAIQ